MKPYGKHGLRCLLCDKKFSTENLMAVHFSRRHREEAMSKRSCSSATSCPLHRFPRSHPSSSAITGWAESMDGELPGHMDEAMLMQASAAAVMLAARASSLSLSVRFAAVVITYLVAGR